ncbi:NUDT8 [Bugula neritina]|uniref:NUDT8 n=1 Tax=Bugula neritina TaxID=10212 RepID=A0A7J7KP19_BUGNE|nr:NUDT8 [Bugula neritina]
MFWHIPSVHLYLLQLLASIRKAGGSVDQINILSEQNKKRCKAQLNALEKSVKHSQRSTNNSLTKQAAVLIPLCFVDCQPSIVFTLRSNKLKKHAAQVSFPGGMASDGDNSCIETALRESEEELGLNMSDVDVWGRMLPIPYSKGDVEITPILANIGKIDVNNFDINYDEVECVFTRDILSLCSAKSFAQTTFTSPGNGYTTPVFLGGEHKIWGLTAIMLHQTLNLIAPGMYKNKLTHPRTIGLATRKK